MKKIWTAIGAIWLLAIGVIGGFFLASEPKMIQKNLQLVGDIFNFGGSNPLAKNNLLDVIEIKMTSDQLENVRTAREEKYTVSEPLPSLAYNGEELTVAKIKTRGSSTHKFDKKSLSVDLAKGEAITIGRKSNNDEKVSLSNFKLNNLVYDDHYFENRIGYDLLTSLGLNPLFYKYVALYINDQPEGIYFLIEDPNTALIEDEEEARCLFERGWYGLFELANYRAGEEAECEEQKQEIENMYLEMANMEGMVASEYLRTKINMVSYYRKMAMDYLLQNGDYTDELYLYGDLREGPLEVFGWDYDDIFSEEGPHEVHSPGGIGVLFGERKYEDMATWQTEFGEKMVMSVEDDLDYKIITDPVLYAEYLAELEIVARAVSDGYLDNLEDKILEELKPLYAEKGLLARAKEDEGSPVYTWTNLEKKLAQRMEEIKVRREKVLRKI